MLRIGREDGNIHSKFDPSLPPLATVGVGDRLEVETAHHLAMYKRVLTEDDLLDSVSFDQINPLTGPIEIRGSVPGDTLVVRIESIEVGAQGDLPLIPHIGLMQEHLDAPYMRILEVRDGTIAFGDGIEIPVVPLVGAIGTCPTEPVYTIHGGDHGGNIDDPNLGPGATLYLPVFVPGAMLFLGDVHARQGDTEWAGTLEVDALVTITIVEVRKGHGLECVWAETADRWIVYASKPDLYDSIETAAERITRFAARGFGLRLEDAALLMGIVSELRICQSVRGPFAPVVRAELPKEIDPHRRLAL
jgi:amidase